MRVIGTIALVALLTGTSLAADPLPAGTRADIERLLELTGALSISQQMSAAMISQMTQNLKSTHPGLPQEMVDVVTEEVNAVMKEQFPQLKEIVVQVYGKYFTDEEIKGMIAFYSTGLGKKVISVMPGLAQESVAAGIQWGRSMGPEIERRIKARAEKQGIKL